jgi:hypothetical protein
MKQAKVLDELGENGGAGMSAEGGSEMKVNYFDHMVNQISKEIHDLMGICANVLALPRQYYKKQKKDGIENQWRIIQDQMKNEVTKVLGLANDANTDHIALLSKLMNLKDNLQRQVFVGVLYRKLIIWMDLNIQSDEYEHNKVVDCISLISDLKEEFK